MAKYEQFQQRVKHVLKIKPNVVAPAEVITAPNGNTGNIGSSMDTARTQNTFA